MKTESWVMKIDEFKRKLIMRYPTINCLTKNEVYDLMVVSSVDDAWLFDPNGNMDVTRTEQGFCKYFYEWCTDRGWEVDWLDAKKTKVTIFRAGWLQNVSQE